MNKVCLVTWYSDNSTGVTSNRRVSRSPMRLVTRIPISKLCNHCSFYFGFDTN